MLPNAVFSWAASRSGLGLGEFIASLTPEREEEWLQAYNSWRAEKGLKTISAPKLAPKPAPLPATPKPPAEPQDELVELMESVADQIDREELELQRTIQEIDAMPVEEETALEEIEEEIILADDNAAAPTVIDATPISDNHMGNATSEQTSVIVEVPIEQRIDKLSKDATPAIYDDILSSMAGDVEALKAVTETVIKDHTRRHRGTAAQRAFLSWLEEHTPAQPNER